MIFWTWHIGDVWMWHIGDGDVYDCYFQDVMYDRIVSLIWYLLSIQKFFIGCRLKLNETQIRIIGFITYCIPTRPTVNITVK